MMLTVVLVLACAMVPNNVARASTGCVDGYYVLWARGSGQGIGAGEANAFRGTFASGNGTGWDELGDLDDKNGQQDPGGYPAVSVAGALAGVLNSAYANSVVEGKNELVVHLKQRYANNGCSRETLILGGYSQGADVVGWAMQELKDDASVDRHIGYAALYGDPKFEPGPMWDRVQQRNFSSSWWWVRGNSPGVNWIKNSLSIVPTPAEGFLYARRPYVAESLKERFGSWCASGDPVCSGALVNVMQYQLFGVVPHTTAYRNQWIADSRNEIQYLAGKRREQLTGVPNTSPVTPPRQPVPQAPADPVGTPAPAQPHIRYIERAKGPDGTNQVYAATKTAVTEGWWRPGGDGIHTSEIIHIAQNDIVGIDKTNLPDNKQSLYTAVPDGVWETWWDSQHSPSSAKIVTGLSGVRQVIVDNRWEGEQYVHRLYILAQDGPYEAWWKDGDPEGIHLNRLDSINGAVTMTKSIGPDGTDQLYVATPTWAYELWWRPGEAVHHSPIINITQADIRSLSKLSLPGGQQRLYTGTSTGMWQSIWQWSTPAHNHEVSGQTGVIQIEAMTAGQTFQAYLATSAGIREYWWHSSGAGNSYVLSRSDITTFDKYNDGSVQQVYTGTSTGAVYETWWGTGNAPATNRIFTVPR